MDRGRGQKYAGAAASKKKSHAGAGTGTSGGSSGASSSSRDTLLAAVALQDHIARTMRIPGGPKAMPSMEPGSGLTLAQTLGLVPRPPPLLTEAEWDEVHLKARTRQDSTQECPICREEFKDEAQVLLSCSHVFHRACLSSYERFAHTRACPLCRSQMYQRKTINDGAESYRTACATRIQAVVRGWLARKQYRALRKHHAPADPRLKRVWAAERLEEESDRLLDEMDDERGDIDALFAELDASLAQSRKVCDEIARPVAQRLRAQLEEAEAAVQQARDLQGQQWQSWSWGRGGDGTQDEDDGGGEGSRPTALLDVDLYGGATARVLPAPASNRSAQAGSGPRAASASSAAATVGPSSSSVAVVDWPGVVARAKARGETECPICIGALGRRGKKGARTLASPCRYVPSRQPSAMSTGSGQSAVSTKAWSYEDNVLSAGAAFSFGLGATLIVAPEMILGISFRGLDKMQTMTVRALARNLGVLGCALGSTLLIAHVSHDMELKRRNVAAFGATVAAGGAMHAYMASTGVTAKKVSVPRLVANLGIGGALFLSGVGEEMGVLPKRNRDREPSGGHGVVKA